METTAVSGPSLAAPSWSATAAAPAALLSDAERRVADLVALGLRNREIAKRLFITVSTVEQHLTRVYRKFGVRGRAGLVDFLSAAREEHAGGE